MKSISEQCHQGSPVFTAIYRASEVDEYRENPLIASLPPILSDEDWFTQLDNPVAFDAKELLASAHIRSHYVLRLRHFYQPLPQHLELASRIDQIIRQGYIGRNPATKDRAALLQKLYKNGQKDNIGKAHYSAYEPISSISLIGYSGMGKSTTAERIQGCYPQVIEHPKFSIYQIVWMKLDCPPDGSIKQLAMNFIIELDRILQTDYHKQISSRIGTDELMQKVKHLATVYSLGLLVIDEIQNLSVKKSGGRESMMNFFQELCNTLHVPIMLMGTMKAMRILQLDFRQARRNAAVGAFAWEPMRNDKIWSFFLESLWEYQWVKNPSALTKELSDIIYKESQGIVAVVSTAFMMAQLRAIRTGEEKLSADLFSRVMKKDMAPIQPMLKALRSGDPRRIANYEDIQPLNMDEMLDREKQGIIVGELRNVKKKKVVPTIENKAIESLLLMGFEQAEAITAVEHAMRRQPKTASSVVRYALDKLVDSDETVEVHPDDDDLRRYAVEEGIEILIKDGVVKK